MIELDTRAQSVCTKIGANGETVTISVNTEESHESTHSGTHIFQHTHLNEDILKYS